MDLLIIAIVVLNICFAISIVFFERKTPQYASRLKNIFEEDLKKSTEVNLESLDKRTVSGKIWEPVARLFSPLL
jgi:regulatory protein YycI of two-component signal transduction system YycFG